MKRLTTKDLKTIAYFKRIVKNYLKMKHIQKLALIFLFSLFAFAGWGQKVVTYQGDKSLMDEGKGTFDVGTESWGVYGNNTIENDAGALKITYVDNNVLVAYNGIDEIGDVNTDLIIGKTYKIKFKAKINTGLCTWRIRSGGINLVDIIIDNTEYIWREAVFVNQGSTIIRIQYIDDALWIDEWSIQEWYPDGRVIMYDVKVLKYTE